MATKDAFLARLRKKMDVKPHENLPHPLPAAGPIPQVEYPKPLDDLVDAFTQASQALGVTVRTVSSESEGEQLIADVVKVAEAQRAVVSRDPETAGVADVLRSLGVEAAACDDRAQAAAAGLGITGAAYGIAATGTLVLDAARAAGRTASLLPPVWLALLPAGRIVAHSGELLRRLPERFPGGLASQMVFATGPSSTGDIELVHTVGVHAPGTVWVGILIGV